MFKLCPKLLPKFKGFCSSPSVILLFVYMKCRFSLSYRELEEMMIIRGAAIDHSTLQRWVKRFVSLIDERVRQRKKPVNGSWRMDETYIKLNGKWAYLYRAVDKEGNTIDFLLRVKEMQVLPKLFLEKLLRKMEDRIRSLSIRAAQTKQLLTHLTKGLQTRIKLRFGKSNILTMCVNKTIDLSRNEPGRCWDLRTFIQQKIPFQELKISA